MLYFSKRVRELHVVRGHGTSSSPVTPRTTLSAVRYTHRVPQSTQLIGQASRAYDIAVRYTAHAKVCIIRSCRIHGVAGRVCTYARHAPQAKLNCDQINAGVARQSDRVRLQIRLSFGDRPWCRRSRAAATGNLLKVEVGRGHRLLASHHNSRDRSRSVRQGQLPILAQLQPVDEGLSPPWKTPIDGRPMCAGDDAK